MRTRTATRLAFHLLRDPELCKNLGESLLVAKDKVRRCERCGDFTATELCSRCSDTRRDGRILCVVERTQDLQAIARATSFRGHFHVLDGTLSPLDGIGPDQLRIRELLARIEGEVAEVILALNPSVEGDATALYLARLLKPLGIKVSRLARGISVGAELEYTDSGTISRAIDERREV